MKTLLLLLFCVNSLIAQDTSYYHHYSNPNWGQMTLELHPYFWDMDTGRWIIDTVITPTDTLSDLGKPFILSDSLFAVPNIYSITYTPDSCKENEFGVLIDADYETMQIYGIYEGKSFFIEISKKGEILQQENIKP